MIDVLARRWWVLVIRGVIAILFGIGAWIWPGATVTVLVLLFGAYALVDGIFAIIEAIRAIDTGHWLGTLLEGIVGIVIGVITFVWPGITALALLYVIAAWALITGVAEIAAAVRLRREIEGEWLLGLAGVLSILFGLLLIIFPGAGVLSVTWLIGTYAIIFGVVLIGLGLRLRGWAPGGGRALGS